MGGKRNRHTGRSASRPASPGRTLRIVGGRLRGRPIRYLGDPRTRPMKQRVREAAFNLIGSRVQGTHVVDLFAGTGAITWEAFSRGAVSATVIERHFPTVRVLRENASTLGLTDHLQVVAGDAFVWARRLPSSVQAGDTPRPWLACCSPPYDFYVERREDMLWLTAAILEAAPAGSVVLVEADERFDMGLLPSTVTWDVRPYSPAVLAVGELPAGTEV